MSERRKERALPQFTPGVLAAAEQAMAGGKLKHGEVYMIDVQHDAWCRLVAGQGPCNCNPEICPPVRVPSPEENSESDANDWTTDRP
jgi:hypothetical protein